MNAIDFLGAVFLIVGAAFFLAGTIGLLRFPDVYTRLHALTKVDNLGLGFTLFGLLFRVDDIASGLKLILIWLLVLAASTAVSFLIMRRARRRGIPHWQAERQP